MPQRIIDLLDPRLLTSGVWKSVDEAHIPLWSDGENVDFRQGKVMKSRGYSAFLTSPVAVNALDEALVSGVKRAYLGTTTALYYYPDGGAVTAIRTGLSSGRWSLLPWGSQLIAANDVDALQYWPNTGTAANITDGPTRARIVRTLNVFIVAFDADGIAGRWEWSDRGVPTVWTPSLSNLAGGDNIRNIASKIMCAENFGNDIIVFSNCQAYLISYVGGTAILAYRTLPLKAGAAGMNCVRVLGAWIFGLEERGFWRSDGVGLDWIAVPAVWDYLKPRIDFAQGDLITCHYDKGTETIEWHWPVVGGGYEGWSYNVETQAWAPKLWRLDAACNAGVWGKPLGANSTAVYKLGDGVNLGASAMPASIQSKPHALGDTDRYKFIEELRMRFSGDATLTIGVGATEDTVDEWLSSETLAARHYPNRDELFWTLKISSTAVDVDWSFAGVEIFGEIGGFKT